MAYPRRSSLLSGLSLLTLAAVSAAACTPVGIAAGAGATLGVASQQEGGLSGAADDIRIKARISDLWFRYDLDTFSRLSLTVDQGRVLVTGIVQNPDARVEAVRLAWQVEGVAQVINEIRLADSEGFPGYVRDGWITTRLRTALTFDREVHSINYSIETVQGTVYLMGAARNQAEIDRVIEIARTIPNVRQVVSYVRLPDEKPPSSAAASSPVSSLSASSALPSPVPAPPSSAVPPVRETEWSEPDGGAGPAPLPGVAKPVVLPP